MAFAFRNRGRQEPAAVDSDEQNSGTAAGSTTREPADGTPSTDGTPRTGRTRLAAARAAWATGSLLMAIARLVRLVAGLVALVLVAAIVLHVVGANGSNTIVKAVNDAGRWLAGPFKGAFTIHGHPKGTLALNWGIAAIVYLIVGALIARLIARIAPAGISPATIRSRRHRGVPPAAPVA